VSTPLLDFVTAQRDAIAMTEPGVRAGDPDAVHDMRVAARRLRATLRAFRPLFDRARTEPLRVELRWLGRLLGAARDGDVLAERLAEAVSAEPPGLVVGPVAARVRQRLADDATRARAELIAGLDGERFAALRDSVDRLAAGEFGPYDERPRRLRRRVRSALRRADRRLDAAAKAPSDPLPGAAGRDDRLHEARKAYKQARYAVEAVAPQAGKPARRLVKRLKSLQDLLGDHQDTIVTRHLLRDHGMRAFADGENAFTYGVLHARQQAAGERTLAGLARVVRRARKGGVRRWLAR
jgi:CHAD domain-containing protein